MYAMGKIPFYYGAVWIEECPASFQRMMDTILDDIQDFSGAYMDDIIIFSQTWVDHVAHMKCVLDRLRKAGLTAKPAKCQWGSATLTFLGHTVGRGMVSTPDHRVEAIRNHVSPVTKKDVQSFLQVPQDTIGNLSLITPTIP